MVFYKQLKKTAECELTYLVLQGSNITCIYDINANSLCN